MFININLLFQEVEEELNGYVTDELTSLVSWLWGLA